MCETSFLLCIGCLAFLALVVSVCAKFPHDNSLQVICGMIANARFVCSLDVSLRSFHGSRCAYVSNVADSVLPNPTH
jgi:hypothetical protein